MAEENKGQAPEQEPVQEEGPAQGPEETQEKDKPAQKKGEGLLMPILYAFLAGVGAFTLVMIVGIVLSFFFQPVEPSEDPSEQESSQVTPAPSSDGTETQAPEESDGPDADDGTQSQAPEESDGTDADDETRSPAPDGEGADTGAADDSE